MAEQSQLSNDELIQKISLAHPDIEAPGYWKLIADNAISWADEVSAQPFWRDARASISKWSGEYSNATNGADLLPPGGLGDFSPKAELSIRDKLLRDCRRRIRRGTSIEKVLKEAIRTSPAIPAINDLVRTRVVCKYLDGVEFLATKFLALAQSKGLKAERTRQGRLTGYFAQHLYIDQRVFYRVMGTDIPVSVETEIQIATELATHLWAVQHDLYEEHRHGPDEPERWQWDPKDPRFISHQLGHTLHLADGLLSQLRDTKPRKR